MKHEDQGEDELPVAGDGRIVQWYRAGVAVVQKPLLWLIDASTRILSRLRNRIEAPPADDDDSDGRKGRGRRDSGTVAAPDAPAATRPRRLVYVLLVALALIVGAFGGAAYSYRLLSKTIAANAVIVDRLRDDLAAMKREESQHLKELAKRQETIRAYDKGIVRFLKEIEDYKAEAEELSKQLATAQSAAKSARRSATSRESREIREGREIPRDGRSAQATTTGRVLRPQQPGTCVTDPANIAASLEKCVGEFNRR